MIHFSLELTNAMNDMIALGATDEQINEIINFKIKSVPNRMIYRRSKGGFVKSLWIVCL